MIFIDIKDWLDKICTIFDFIMSKSNKYYCKVSNLQNILNRYWNIKLVKQILILLLINNVFMNVDYSKLQLRLLTNEDRLFV